MPTTSVFPGVQSVAHRRTLRAAGVSNDRIRTAVRTGRWQEPVRGVVVAHAGGLTQRERWQVALAFAGQGPCLSHHSALRLWGARAAGLPEPEWNAEVETPAGTFFVDALWRDRGVGAEADGREWHLSAGDWADDLVRQNALHGVGLVLLRFPVARLRADRLGCGREIAALVA